ncbi:hypothetical protein Taro_034090 [Colocasia esculenta]|uniref:Uncharacterized protein n=1 Tax=Colocasia esculenta TaxID=4460 RepID=A0A843W8W6_COLES|nr:hypothetical protein [Colocasia esculenta]
MACRISAGPPTPSLTTFLTDPGTFSLSVSEPHDTDIQPAAWPLATSQPLHLTPPVATLTLLQVSLLPLIQAANSHEETLEERVVQRKGRFKVTSADAVPKCVRQANFIGNLVSGVAPNSPVNPSSILPSLQCILQQNTMQREQLSRLIKCIEQAPGNTGQQMQVADTRNSEVAQLQLESELINPTLFICNNDLVEEVQRQKMQNAQLERQVNALCSKKGERIYRENEAR